MVPRLTLLVERLQRAARELDREMHELAQTSGHDRATLGSDTLLRARPAARVLVEELDAVVHEIQQTGVELKDLQLGLIDFPAELDGEMVYLCWQFGEPEVAFWHHPTTGFAGRRPLAGASRPPFLQ